MLTQEQVKRLSDLVRLRFSPEELTGFTDTFQKILGYVDHIAQIPQSSLEWLEIQSSVEQMPLRWNGEARRNIDPKDLLRCSPKKVIGTEVVVAATRG